MTALILIATAWTAPVPRTTPGTAGSDPAETAAVVETAVQAGIAQTDLSAEPAVDTRPRARISLMLFRFN